MVNPTFKKDLENRDDLIRLVEKLYTGLMQDEEIGHFFTKVVPLDLDHHIPKIVDFWNSVLFQGSDYAGDPMAVHLHLDKLAPLEAHDFEVWLRYFSLSVDELFAGENAERAKQRAISIATLMQIKISKARNC